MATDRFDVISAGASGEKAGGLSSRAADSASSDLVECQERLQVVSAAAALLLSSESPETIVEVVAEMVMASIGADVFFNYVLDEDNARLRLNAAGGVDDRIARSIERLELGQAICGCVARDGVRIISEDVQHNGDPRAELVRRMGVQCYACQPLRSDGRTMGTLSFGTKEKTAFTADELELMLTVAGQVSVAIDRSRREAELRRSEERFRAVLEHSLDAAYRHDSITGQYEYISPVIATIIGFTPEEYGAMSSADRFERFHPDDRAHVMTCMDEAEKSGRFACEFRYRHKDGHYVWISDHARLTFDDAGRPLHRSGIVREITHEKMMKAALDATTVRHEYALALADALRSAASEDEIKEVASSLLGRQLGCDRACIAEVDEAQKSTHIAAQHHAVEGMPPLSGRFLLEDLSRRTVDGLTAGRSVVTDDVTQLEHQTDDDRRRYSGSGTRAFALWPILRDERLKIVACAMQSTPRTWLAEELDLLRETAERTWAALERIKGLIALERSTLEAQRLARREETLKQVAQAAAQLKPPDELSADVARLAAGVFGAKHAQIRLLNEQGTLLLKGGVFDPDGFLDTMGDMPLDAPTEPALCARDGEPRFAENIGPSVSEASRRDAAAAAIRSYALLPVRVGEKVIGVFYMGWAEPRAFAEEDQSFMQAVVAQFSVGLQNSRLYEAQKLRRRRIEALHDVLGVAVSTLDVRVAAQRILEHLTAKHDFDLSSAWLANGETLELVGQVGYPEDYQRSVSMSDPYDAVEAFKAGSAVIVRDPENQAVIDLYARMGIELGSYAVFPLIAHDRTIGVLAFVWHAQQDFGASDLEFYREMTTEVAVVLDNARKYETEHNIAETLQETLVVLPRHVPNVAYSRAYESATYQSGRVGGDFVDLFEVRPHLVAISLGDVSGKGIDAAVTTSLVRTTLRVHAIDGLPPVGIVSKANEVVRRLTEVEAFVTLWFGLLNTRNGHLRYICAGHPPALVLGPDGGVQQLDCRDPLLGAFDETTYMEHHAVIGRGERLVLYSDGATEARSADGEFLHESGLHRIVAGNSYSKTSRLASQIMRDVLDFSAGVLRDDAAILVVEPTRLQHRAEDLSQLRAFDLPASAEA